MSYFRGPCSESCEGNLVGGKAKNLWLLGRKVTAAPVPHWFVLTTEAFTSFLIENGLTEASLTVTPNSLKESTQTIQEQIMKGNWPQDLIDTLKEKLSSSPFDEDGLFVAVRSSGTDEDSASHSFAGQFESYLYQRGFDQISNAIKSCWSSCYSERVMSHRLECGMNTTGVKMAVIVQVMVNSEVSGVAFSRHPLKPISSNAVYIESVYGLGEGLVSGEFDADQYEVSRTDLSISQCTVAEKPEQLIQDKKEGGLVKEKVEENKVKVRSLSDDEAKKIAQLMIQLEDNVGTPQDFEWGIEKGQLYCLQARPIVTLPPSCFFDKSAIGSQAVLWDNSNIVESYSGVTSPLTFSFASRAYEQVYRLTMLASGVPQSVVTDYEPYLTNLLGLVRGNIYYNLTNWYRCITCIPMIDNAKYMETMMGVKQSVDPELDRVLGVINSSAPKYSLWTKLSLMLALIKRVYFIDSYVEEFFTMFNKYYSEALATDFEELSLQEQIKYVKHLYKEVLGRWTVPIYNDTYVMIFFGILKKLVAQYLTTDANEAQSLQNDLLCGQGDVESTEPTKMLMRISEHIDTDGRTELKEWFLNNKEEVLGMLSDERDKKMSSKSTSSQSSSSLHSEGLRQRKVGKPDPQTSPTSLTAIEQAKLSVINSILTFLDKYGFRCINELKLEENTLHDDPGFVFDAISGYIHTKAYSVGDMEERELGIRKAAETVVSQRLSFPKKLLFNWILFHSRRGVRHRENMRFARTKLFGIFRNLFRSIGTNFVKLGLLEDRQDVFYLTVDELYTFVDGRAVTNNISGLVDLRKREFEGYNKGLAPPERFLSKGACGVHFLFPQILDDLDLLKEQEAEAASDPNKLKGTPCCPGIVTGVVRVAKTIKETQNLKGEILITARTDPGWVPLYPMCSGLVIERGSLLSHSAVVARELGLPTIVGVSGGLMKRLKTGMRVHIDAGKGVLTILNDDEEQ